MRLFTVLIFDQTVRGTTEVFSPPEHNDTLGKADDIVYEIEVEESSGTSPTLTVKHLQSNSGKKFIANSSDLVQAAAIDTGSLPYRVIKTVTGPLANFSAVSVTLGGTTPSARVRIWATGRSR